MTYILDITSSTNTDFNKGVNFWGEGLFQFDNSLQDKANLLSVVRNYVKLLVGKDISVSYAAQKDESYTDGKSIVISPVVLIDRIDSTIGLGLHEASHVVLSDFREVKKLVSGELLSDRLKPYSALIKDIANWVEDRRIDHWAYNEAPGYKKYYEALYKRYFLSETVDKLILSNSAVLKKETIENYMFYLINSINPNVKMDELPALPAIKAVIDIENVDRWKSINDTIDVAIEITKLILNNLPPLQRRECRNANYKSKTFKSEDMEGSIVAGDIDNMSEKELEDLVSEILSSQEKFNGGDFKDVKSEAMPKDLAEMIEQLIEQPQEEKRSGDLGNGTGGKSFYNDVVVYDKITKDFIFNSKLGNFISANSHYRKIIERGLAIGDALGKKLQLREEVKEVKFTKLKSGKLYKKTVYMAGFDSPNLFYEKHISKFSEIGVHISVDASGSMQGEKWDQTLLPIVAICKGTSSVNNIRTQLSFRSSENSNLAFNFYDSQYDNISKLKLLQYFRPFGGTPEGLCFAAMEKKLMQPLLSKKMLFINFSDGAPAGQHAIEVTKKIIDRFRAKGIAILSYFIKSGKGERGLDKIFDHMYGKDAKYIDTESLFHLAKTISEKLLKLGGANGK